jgi:elongation factor P
MRANNLKKGNVILFNSAPCKIIEFVHVTPGKGNALCQMKLRNLITGVQTETRFSSTADVDIADVFTSKANFLYSDADGFHFMDINSYEQFTLSSDVLDDQVYYLQENMEVMVTLFNDQPISIELPASVILVIAETQPEVKGATATNSPKPATTNTGLQLSVPPFIKEGERIIVSTAEGKYISRAD